MANVTSNTRAFIEAEQYSNFILGNLHDGMLPEGFYRNVSDFGSGETLNIKTIGSATIRDVTENQPIQYDPIDTGEVYLTITEYVGDGWYVTDKLRQDGAQIESMMATRGVEATRAIQEHFETTFLKEQRKQTATSVNAINGFAHRWIADSATAGNHVMGLKDLVAMKLSFDKANAPQSGRIALVDPITEAALNTLATATIGIDRNPAFQGILEESFTRDHKFVMNIMGWDIYTTNRLDRLAAAESIDASGYGLTSEAALAGYIANMFMCVLDDSTKPIMGAWRQDVRTEGERNKDLQRDEFITTGRWGFGLQRPETLGVVITHPTNYV